MIAKLTSKGQLTLPMSVRKRLNLQSGDKVQFIIDDEGRALLIPVKASLLALKGMVPKPKKKVTLADMDEAVEKEGAGL